MRLFVPAVVMRPMPPAVMAMPAMIGAIIMAVMVVTPEVGAMMVPAVMMITRLGISGR